MGYEIVLDVFVRLKLMFGGVGRVVEVVVVVVFKKWVFIYVAERLDEW